MAKASKVNLIDSLTKISRFWEAANLLIMGMGRGVEKHYMGKTCSKTTDILIRLKKVYFLKCLKP